LAAIPSKIQRFFFIVISTLAFKMGSKNKNILSYLVDSQNTTIMRSFVLISPILEAKTEIVIFFFEEFQTSEII
jgi:hypothetical protein